MSEQFDEQGNDFQTDDVEAHRIPDHVGRDLDVEGHKAGIESDLADDTEGHMHAMLEGTEEDTEGHLRGYGTIEGADEDDTEGHHLSDVKRGDIVLDDDDVEGHGLQVQPPRDADNQGNQF